MNLREGVLRLWSKFSKKRSVEDAEMSPSIVLLLRKYHVFTKAEIRVACEKAWHKRFDGKEDPMCYVGYSETGLSGSNSPFVLIKSGRYLISVLHASQPYLEDVESVAQQLPRKEQQKAWRDHSARVSLDLMSSKGARRKETYAVLARLARYIGDANCSGFYLPKEQILLPNDGTADEGLQLMIDGEFR